MTLFILSFIAGVLTVAAPCILPLLPVVVGASVVDGDKAKARWRRPLLITGSLAASVVIFTLLLKATTALLGVPVTVWQFISGGIITLLGAYFLWPTLWEKLAAGAKLSNRSNGLLARTLRVKGDGGSILTGAALGPVFNSCSPTYALIVSVVLPASFIKGFIYLLAYALGLGLTLLIVAFAGQAATSKMRFMTNPHGWFKKSIGLVFIIVGLAVLFGFDKKIQTYVLDRGWYDPISGLEQRLAE